MTPRNHFMLATALGAGLLVAMPIAFGQTRPPEGSTVRTDPGFKPDTGQINTGVEEQVPSQSTQNIPIPTPEESRAATLMPVSKDPSAGGAPSGQQGGSTNPTASTTGQGGGPTGQGESISGGPTPQQAGAEPRSSTTPSAAPAADNAPPPSGPIGSVGETIPAKFSQRNDILDRTPMMALPQPLSDEQRARIFKAVMGDQTQAAPDADKLMPASELSTAQALNGMHPLPTSIGDIEAVKKLKYVKGKTTVLLVIPSTRIVVEQIKAKS